MLMTKPVTAKEDGIITDSWEMSGSIVKGCSPPTQKHIVL